MNRCAFFIFEKKKKLSAKKIFLVFFFIFRAICVAALEASFKRATETVHTALGKFIVPKNVSNIMKYKCRL